MLEVVAALICADGRFLVCQRPAHKARGLLWEFVGGKVEPGETPQQALARECREELDIGVEVGEKYFQVTHTYPDTTVHLTLFCARICRGAPRMLEHAAMAWITPEEIEKYEFCPADEVILDKLRQGLPLWPQTPAGRVRDMLLTRQDTGYRDFQCALMPTVPTEQVIGVRMPELRQLARQLAGTEAAEAFLNQLPHQYYEENNLHGLLLCAQKDYAATLAGLEKFLPFVDNWATCDLLSPRAFKSHPAQLPQQIQRWLQSPLPYTRRFGVGMLLQFYLDDAFSPAYLEWAAQVEQEEYYVSMMVAWFFATALAKQYSQTVPWLEQRFLPRDTHNRAIQKAVESRRLTQEQKQYLRTLRWKE